MAQGGQVNIYIDHPSYMLLLKKLRASPSIPQQSLMHVMKTAAQEALSIFRRNVPRKSGQLQSSAHPVSGATWAKVDFNATGHAMHKGRPFRYGYAISYSTRRYPKTYGYFQRTEQQVAQGPARKAGQELANEMQRLWSAG